MKDFEKIEHLLLSKRFEELSPTEVKEVNGYFEGATDYNDMRDTLMQVKSTLAADKLLIKPNVELKEKLLQQFDNTYTNTNRVIGKTRPFYKHVAFQWSAAASVVLLLSLGIFMYMQDIKSNSNDGMAVNYETPASKDAKDEAPTTTGETYSPMGISEETNQPSHEMMKSVNGPQESEDIVVSDMEMGENELKQKPNQNPLLFGTFDQIRSENSNATTITKNDVNYQFEQKEEKLNADFYFNGVINVNNPKNSDDSDEDQLLKGKIDDKREDNKNLNTNGYTNTVNFQRENNKINFSSNRNNEVDNKKVKENTVNLGLSEDKYADMSSTDSTKTKNKTSLDSLKLDSNKNSMQLDSNKNFTPQQMEKKND